MAADLGLAANTLSQYENEKRELDIETAKRIAEYLGVSVDVLVGGAGDITDAMYKEVRNFAAYVKQREAEKKE